MITKLILLAVAALIVGCGNEFRMPGQVNSEVTIKDSTQTIRHEIVVSAEMTSLFETTCTAQVDATPLPEPVRSESIKLCVAKATQEFIAGILALINQGAP